MDSSLNKLVSPTQKKYFVRLFWFRLESTNPKKNSETLDAFQLSEWSIWIRIVYLFGSETSRRQLKVPWSTQQNILVLGVYKVLSVSHLPRKSGAEISVR